MTQARYCKYHSEIPAKWYCPDCRIALCSHCVMEEQQKGDITVCPACDKALRKLSTAHAIPPFWKRMPKTFLYPFNGGSIIYLTGLSLFSLLFFTGLWPIIIVTTLILPLMMLRYGFSVLQHTAMGHLTPPKMSFNFELHELTLSLKLIALMITLSFLLGLITFPFGPQSMAAQGISFVVSQLLMPALIILLAVHSSYFRAINPANITFVISTLGLPYLALCGVFLLLGGGPPAVFFLLGGMIPMWMAGMFVVFTFGYFAVVTFHLLGYVAYQYHEDLGIRPEVEYTVQLKSSDLKKETGGNSASPSFPVLQKVRMLVKEGMQQAAKATLQKELKHSVETDSARLEMHQLYHQMLLNDQEHEEALEHARGYIPMLLEQGKGKQALSIFRECTGLDPAFQLATAEDIHQLASAAHKAEEHQLVLSLMNYFVQKHADYPDAIELLLMAAHSLQHHFRQDEKARKILQYIIQRYPQDERSQRAKRSLMQLERAT